MKARASAASAASTTSITSSPSTTTVSVMTTMTASSAAATTTGMLLTNYTVAAPSTVFSLSLECPADGTTYTTRGGHTYAVTCTRAQGGGDVGAHVAYTYQECIEACGSMNDWQANNQACTVLQFYSYLANITSTGYFGFGNCFLKNASAQGSAEPLGGLSATLTT